MKLPSLTPLAVTDLNEAKLLDAMVYGADDELIGTVSHVHGMGIPTSIIVDVGGFLGIGSKFVLMKTGDLQFMRDDGGNVLAVTTWTKDQVEALPEHHD